MENYEVVRSHDRLAHVADEIGGAQRIALDLETTSLKPWRGKVRLCSVNTGQGVYVIDVFETHGLGPVAQALNTSKAVKVLQNAKFDQRFFLYEFQVELYRVFDTFRASYMLHNGRKMGHNLWDLYRRELQYEPTVQDLGGSNWSGPLDKAQFDYAADDVIRLPMLFDALRRQVIEAGLGKACGIEFGSILPEAAIELAGLYLDREKWTALAEKNRAKAKLLKAGLFAKLSRPDRQIDLFAAGSGYEAGWNVDSNQQLLKALANMGVKLEDTKKTTLAMAVGKYPIVKDIMEYRKVSKRSSSFGETYLRFIDPVTGRVHCSYWPLTDAGRYSCSDPNLQQQPREKEFRACWSAGQGYKLIGADYCLAAGTLVDTPTGEKPIEEMRSGDLIFSFNRKTRRPDCSKVALMKATGLRETLVVVLDNGEQVRCTPEHRWLLVDGTERQAGELAPGDRLLPLRRSYAGPKMYETMYSRSAYAYVYTHKAVAAAKVGVEIGALYDVVHHVDENCLNNDPDNLEILSAHDHASLHGRKNSVEQWKDPVVRERMRLGISRALSARGGHGGEKNPNFGNRRGAPRTCEACGREFYKPPSAAGPYCNRFCYTAARRAQGNLSHKVARVERDGLVVPTYDLTVARDQNFALAAGVYVHNSQVELRIAAELSGDETLIKIYTDHEDAHLRTASIIGQVDMKSVTKELRQQAKPVNFGLLYGMGPEKLMIYAMTNYGVALTLHQSETFVKRFFASYDGLKDWQKRTVRDGQRTGIARTVAGRLRYLEPTEYSTFLNSPVQGTGADGLKASMAIFYEKLKKYGKRAFMVHMVHDEILTACEDDAELCKAVAADQSAAMVEGMQPFLRRVPVLAESSIGASWADKV